MESEMANSKWITAVADTLIRDVLLHFSGVYLLMQPRPIRIGNHLCAYTESVGRYEMNFALCVEEGLLQGIVNRAFHGTISTQEDMQEYAQELINILAGRFLSALYHGSDFQSRLLTPKSIFNSLPEEVQRSKNSFSLYYLSKQGEAVAFHWTLVRSFENGE